jgi:hypothetical protein
MGKRPENQEKYFCFPYYIQSETFKRRSVGQAQVYKKGIVCCGNINCIALSLMDCLYRVRDLEGKNSNRDRIRLQS